MTTPTIASAARRRPDRGSELVFGPAGAELVAGRWEFTDERDLLDHLGKTFEASESERGGLRGTLSRKGTYVRRRADGSRAVTLGDPVLDEISSPVGELVVGGRTLDLRPSRGNSMPPVELLRTDVDGDVERWASDDGSTVEYRADGATLKFRAWKRKTFYGYWSIGAEITTTGGDFEAAAINSRYYDTFVNQVCGVEYDSDGDTHDDHLDEYEWGWNSPQPRRVESLCRAQWRGERFADVVFAGDECPAANVEPWPVGWPESWPPDTGVEVRPTKLSMSTRSVGVVARASTNIVNHDSSELSATVGDATGPEFNNPTGTLRIPPNSEKAVTVTFHAPATGVYRSTLAIQAGGRTFSIPITATVTQVGEPL